MFWLMMDSGVVEGFSPEGAAVNRPGRQPLDPPTPARNPAPKGRQSLQASA